MTAGNLRDGLAGQLTGQLNLVSFSQLAAVFRKRERRPAAGSHLRLTWPLTTDLEVATCRSSQVAGTCRWLGRSWERAPITHSWEVQATMTNTIKGVGFSKTARVQRVLVERAGEGLTLSLRLSDAADHTEVDWYFDGVTQLRFRGESTDLLNLVLLQSEDLTSNGWDGVRYRVTDYEEEFVSFYCIGIGEGKKPQPGQTMRREMDWRINVGPAIVELKRLRESGLTVHEALDKMRGRGFTLPAITEALNEVERMDCREINHLLDARGDWGDF